MRIVKTATADRHIISHHYFVLMFGLLPENLPTNLEHIYNYNIFNIYQNMIKLNTIAISKSQITTYKKPPLQPY